MTCSCGGQFRAATNTAVRHTLDYSVCKSCGRAGYWRLYAPDGTLLQSEEAARVEFLRLASPRPNSAGDAA